jgi:hypothetical protein
MKRWRRTICWVVAWATKGVEVMKILWVEALWKLRLGKVVGKLLGRGGMARIFWEVWRVLICKV